MTFCVFNPKFINLTKTWYNKNVTNLKQPQCDLFDYYQIAIGTDINLQYFAKFNHLYYEFIVLKILKSRMARENRGVEKIAS